VTQHRNHPLLKISQPVFLLIILLGASIGLSSIISFVSMHISISSQQAYNIGKAGIESLSSSSANAACQSLGWLLITGFGLTVPVLILKTWRLHKIIVKARLGGTRRRQHVKELDMFKAIGLFLLIAYVIMIAWTFTTPLYYVVEILHVDSWGNPVKSYGYCKLDGPEAQGFFVTLVMLVLVSIISGNFVCFIARNDESVNNEVTYISLSLFNFLEMLVLGGPVGVILIQHPQERFLVFAFVCFTCFEGCVLLMFVPKIIAVFFYDPESAQYTIKADNGIQLGNSTVSVNSVMKNTWNYMEQEKNAQILQKEQRNLNGLRESSQRETIDADDHGSTVNPIVGGENKA